MHAEPKYYHGCRALAKNGMTGSWSVWKLSRSQRWDWMPRFRGHDGFDELNSGAGVTQGAPHHGITRNLV